MEGITRIDRQLEGNFGGLLWRPADPVFRVERGLVAGGEHPQRRIVESDRSFPGVWEWVALPRVGDACGYAVFSDGRCKGLHRKFARIARAPRERRDAAVVKFANQFGLLGPPERGTELYAPNGPAVATMFGEPLRHWWQESCRMAALVALWDLVRADRIREVAKYVVPRFDADRAKVFPSGDNDRIEVFLAWHNGRLTTSQRYDVDWRVPTYREEWTAGEGYRANIVVGEYRRLLFQALAKPKPDLALAARLFLLDEANRELTRTRVEFRLDAPIGPLAMIAPGSLLAAIYVHLAWEVVGNRATGTACVVCNAPMRATRRGHRYCGAACRKAAERERKRLGVVADPVDA